MLNGLEKFIEENKTALLLLFTLIALIGTIVGWRYYSYTKEAPEFCLTCHMMQDSFYSWQKSRHRQINCQRCHQMSVLEQNRLLVAYVAKGATGPTVQKHGRAAPWKACKDCHVDDLQQGSVSVRKSFGHAKHVFMQNIGCENCHSGHSHTFAPDQDDCLRCHKGKLVHGLGMEGLSCLKCHNYKEDASEKVSMERCLGCHTDIGRKGPMGSLKCFDCHRPHERINLTSADCLTRCNGNEVQVGQHRLHMEKAGLKCLDCHRPHSWVVGKKQAQSLCGRCHAVKDPARFIY